MFLCNTEKKNWSESISEKHVPVLDVERLPNVELMTDQKMCPVFNKQQEEASVEPCMKKSRFICVGPKKTDSDSFHSTSTGYRYDNLLFIYI